MKYLFLIFFGLFSLLSQAQNLKIKIFDESTKTEIQDVQIIGLRADSTLIFSQFYFPKNNKAFEIKTDLKEVSFLYLNHLNYLPKQVKLKEKILTLSDESYFSFYLKPIGNTLDEVSISAQKFNDSSNKTSLKINKLDAIAIEKTNSTNAIDLIERSENVYVQKSQMGGGSPVLRGFEANKIVLSIEGIKMNNAIYRGGHLQNALSVGHLFVDNLEILNGPGSITYGSDALGGVINFSTLKIKPKTHSFKIHSNYNDAASGANLGVLYQNYLNPKHGFIVGASFSRYNGYTVGKWRPKNRELWGNLPIYVVQNENSDSVVQNENPSIIPATYAGYTQQDFLLKYTTKSNWQQVKIDLLLNASFANNIPRFDRLNDIVNDSLPRFADWRYGKQNRILSYAKFNFKEAKKLYTEFKTTIAHQFVEESRENRPFNNPMQRTQNEGLNILSIATDFYKKFSNDENSISQNIQLQYGAEYILNTLKSTAFEKNVWNSEIPESAAITRYPNGKNYTQSLDIYALTNFQASEKLAINIGMRISSYQLKIAFDTIPFPDLILENKSTNIGLTYTLGLNYTPYESARIKANISSGFRAPNIDDVGKIFDPAPQVLVVPNTNVLPEYVYNFDLSWKQRLSTFANFETGTYFTRAKNLIRRAPNSISDKDSIFYDNENFAIYSNTNVGKANLAGCYASLKFYKKGFKSSHNLHYTYGKDLSENVPLGHIPPLYGKSDISYSHKNWDLQFWTQWNAAKKLEHYSPFSEDKLEEALPNGTPAWATVNFQINKKMVVAAKKGINTYYFSFSGENLMDLHYKPFASGIAASGRNIKFKIVVEF